MASARFKVLGATLLTCISPGALAETTTYTYDAKGRLVQTVKAGGPGDGTTTTYSHDKADNRTRVVTAGAVR
nr:hypothetical protein [Sphingomonas yabuuchiae]